MALASLPALPADTADPNPATELSRTRHRSEKTVVGHAQTNGNRVTAPANTTVVLLNMGWLYQFSFRSLNTVAMYK